MAQDFDRGSIPPSDDATTGDAPGQSVIAAQEPVRALERMTRLVAALDAVAAALQREQQPEAIFDLGGKALHALGIESQISLLERPPGAAYEPDDDAVTSSALRIAYISVAPGMRNAIERVIGGSVLGFAIPLERVAVFHETVRTQQPCYLTDTLPAWRQLAYREPESIVRQLMHLTHATTAVVAPLLSHGRVLGLMCMWADGLRAEDASILTAFARQTGIALGSAQLQREVERERARFETVFDTGPGALAVVAGPDDILRVANSRLRALSACPEREPVGLSIHRLFPAERMSLVGGLPATLAAVRHTQRPVTLRGVALHTADRRAPQTVTLHVAPMQVHGPPTDLHHGVAPAPTAEHHTAAVNEELLLVMWDTTAHVRAEDQLAAQVRRAETLARVALALGHERELPALLEYIAQAALALTDADGAGFLLRAAPDERFQVVATAGVDPGTLRALHRTFVADLSILRPLLAGGPPVLLSDASAVVAGAESRLFTRARLRALAATPLKATEGWILGTLVVGHHVPGIFAAEHIELLDALAAQATTAIERTRTLEQARHHADNLEAIFASLVEGVAICDEHGTMLRMNAAAERITRRRTLADEDAAMRRERFGLRHSDGTMLLRDEMPSMRAVHGETFYGAEYLLDGEHGPNTVISASGAPLLHTDGHIRGGVVVFRDVTHVRRLERRTHEALDALLRMAAALVAPTTASPSARQTQTTQPPSAGAPGGALSSMGDASATPDDSALYTTLRQFCQLAIGVIGCDRVGIYLIDPDTRVIDQAAIAGLDPATDGQLARGQPRHPVLGRFGEPGTEELAGRLLAGETVIFDMTQPPYTALPNPYRATLMALVPMLVEGQLVGMLALDHQSSESAGPAHSYSQDELALAQGVSRLAALAVERQRLERVVAEVEALRAANSLKEDFLSIASHELKTPLTVLQARTQATQRRLIRMGHPDAAAQFATVQTSLNRILSLVQDLLDASRIQAGQLDLRFDPSDLGQLLQAAVSEEQEASGHLITLAGQHAPGLVVAADAERLEEVLMNLIDNAVKYSRPERPIDVRIWRQPGQGWRRTPGVTSPRHDDAGGIAGDEVIVTVTDAGVGIPQDEVEHVFERFYRARTSSSRNYGGLGLSLHIAATIVQRHGGRIWAESAGPGQGSTFGIALPALDQPSDLGSSDGAATG